MKHSTRPAAAAILFDLDGTLTDPVEGITRSIAYALDHLAARPRSRPELVAAIGPPLRSTFARWLATDDTDVIERAMVLYRERYAAVGLFENAVYPEIPELLARLHVLGYALYVATAKPTIFATQIIEHFALAPYFTAIYGAELDGRFDQKAELIAHLLQREPVAPATTVMVGDRSHDILAAKAHGLRAIGVTYGYGTEVELTSVHADCICHSPAEIAAYFAR